MSWPLESARLSRRVFSATLLIAAACVVVAVTLSACATSVLSRFTEEERQRLTPASIVYALEQDLKLRTGAFRRYAEMPFCSPPVIITPCAEPTIVIGGEMFLTQAQTAIAAARVAVDGQQAPADLASVLGDAQLALNALSAYLAEQHVKDW